MIYYIVDVFTNKPFGGNQLAVFLDLEDKCSDEQMLAIAREINFSETTFIKGDLGENTFRVRIFTPEYEVPFAGHPVLGTAYVIHHYLSGSNTSELILDVPHGLIPISISKKENDMCYSMVQAQPEFYKTYKPEDISSDLGISIDDLDTDIPIQEISTGLPYLIIPMKSLNAVQKLHLKDGDCLNFLKRHHLYKSNSVSGLTTAFFFITSETVGVDTNYHARMFCYENGHIVEDAATGSANGCALAYLLKYRSSEIEAVVEQGFEMNRPSYIHINGSKEKDYYHLNVKGHVVEISSGSWNTF